MIGNNFELLDRIRIVRITDGGGSEFSITFDCLEKLGSKCSAVETTTTETSAKTGEILWMCLRGSRSWEGGNGKGKLNLMDLMWHMAGF